MSSTYSYMLIEEKKRKKFSMVHWHIHTIGVLSSFIGNFLSWALLLGTIRRNKQSHSALKDDRQRITIQCASSMHVIRDGLYLDIGWLVITAARYRYRLYCESLEWIPFLFSFSFVVWKRMLLSFICEPEAMATEKQEV